MLPVDSNVNETIHFRYKLECLPAVLTRIANMKDGSAYLVVVKKIGNIQRFKCSYGYDELQWHFSKNCDEGLLKAQSLPCNPSAT